MVGLVKWNDILEIKKIDFFVLKNYWEEVKHFHIANKIITENVIELGPYKSKYDMNNQKTQAYGLFENGYMIGGTQIIEWDDGIIRWRANNIRESHRGKGLFYNLQSTIIANDWSNKTTLLGWFRSAAMWWPPLYNFDLYDGVKHNHDGDVYMMVTKPIKDLCKDYTDRENKIQYG